MQKSMKQDMDSSTSYNSNLDPAEESGRLTPEEGRSEGQCRSLDPVVVKGFWTAEEDKQIIDLVDKYGTKSWAKVAQHLRGRRGKQCRERWINHLDPIVNKGSWTKEEDLILAKAHSILGNHWVDIARLLPGRSCNSVKNHWHCTIKRQAEQGLFKKEVENIKLDLQKLEAEKEMVSDPECASAKGEKQPKPIDAPKDMPSPPVLPSNTGTPRGRPPSQGPASRPGLSSGQSPDASPVITSQAAADPKKLVEAALKMISLEMLPLSFVDGLGFRSFMSIMCPQHSRLSQRAVGLQLYEDVERTYKPQLIRDLKSSLTKSPEGEGVIHVSVDLWAGSSSSPSPPDGPIVIVQLHFISESWQVRRPIVAFRHLDPTDLSASLSRELEAVLLSYGIFTHHIGRILTSDAKQALAANSLFCDYKFTLNRAEAEGEEMVSFLSDQLPEEDSPFSEIKMGSIVSCVSHTLQRIIKEALKDSRVVENLLVQLQNVVAFFRRKPSWSEVLMKECGALLWPPPGSCRWNSMLMSLRRIVQESIWSSVMICLAQARSMALDSTDAPPLVMVKREQVQDILGLLGPFETALQTLQGNGACISCIIPAIVQLDKNLSQCQTNYRAFSKALRTGLRSHCQGLLHNKDLVLATVLDHRVKLQPFPKTTEEQTDYISPPSKSEARSIIEAALNLPPSSATSASEENGDDPGSAPEENEQIQKTPPSKLSGDPSPVNKLKRKSLCALPQPPQKSLRLSELEKYLSESTSTGSCVLFWKTAQRFPGLQSLARRLLSAPVTTGGFDRLYPMSACIMRARRNRLSAHTTERLLLYKDSSKSSSVKRPSKV